MAGETETIQVNDDGIVMVDIGDIDQPELALQEESGKKPEPAPKPTRTRQPAAADEAAAALTAAQKLAETEATARKAAEETAQAERRAREDAERRAQQSGTEAQTYREQAQNNELVILTNGIEGATREIAAAKAEYIAGFNDGDATKMSDAQEKMGRATAALDRLEAAKADFEARRPVAPLRPETAEVSPQQQSAFELYVSGFQPGAQAWLRAHPDCVPESVRLPNGQTLQLGGNRDKNKNMMRGHHAALAQDIAEGTPDYFRVIEEHTGYRSPTSAAASTTAAGAEASTAARAPAPRQRQAQPSAPVSRDAPGGAPRGSQMVKLTTEQQEAARISRPDLPPAQAYALYAKGYVDADAEGKIGRVGH